jgi:hypothetical protein
MPQQAPAMARLIKAKASCFCSVGGWHDLAVQSQWFFCLSRARACVCVLGAGELMELGDDGSTGLPFQPISWDKLWSPSVAAVEKQAPFNGMLPIRLSGRARGRRQARVIQAVDSGRVSPPHRIIPARFACPRKDSRPFCE